LTIHLVRHVKAGERRTWDGDDRLRAVSKAGQQQARALATSLAEEPFERIVSSPYVRCIESVAPLASMRGLAIEIADGLAEEATLEEALSVVRKCAAGGAVLCSHGDVIPMLLEHYARQGVDLGPRPQCVKASTWVLTTSATGDVTAARYVPPPAE
jgi:8-oxo-dGTP diphosphatase